MSQGSGLVLVKKVTSTQRRTLLVSYSLDS